MTFGASGSRNTLVLAAGLFAVACIDEFPLGSWNTSPAPGAGGSEATAGTDATGGTDVTAGTDATGGTEAGAGTDASGGLGGSGAVAGSAEGATAGAAGTEGGAGSTSTLPACLEPGIPGPPNPPGTSPGTTDTITSFVWDSPMDSMEWELRIERPLETDGYYWMNQFQFTDLNAGYFGIQERGGYYTTPGMGDLDWVKMIVFWISGPPVEPGDLPNRGEVGDIKEPDARVLPDSSGRFITIHTKWEWEYCRPYRLRVGLESTEMNGDRWIGAWILDVDAGEEIFFGRIRMPADSGQIVPFNSFRTTRIERALTPPMNCTEAEHSSALFGWPTANLGTMKPQQDDWDADFPRVTRCATSRFTMFPTAIRHELGIERN